MGSEDTYHKDHPETNAWMKPGIVSVHSGAASTLTVQERLSETSPAGRPLGIARTVMSGLVQRLAIRLGKSPDELAALIPDDTIRRTKFPVTEILTADGGIEFQHPSGIIEGARSTHVTGPRQT